MKAGVMGGRGIKLTRQKEKTSFTKSSQIRVKVNPSREIFMTL